MKRWFVGTGIVLSTLMLSTTVLAATLNLKAVPLVYDPDHTNAINSKWIKHIGLPDDQGNQNFGLLLDKNTLTVKNAAAVANVLGVQGLELNEIGFDIRDETHCGAGSPRFNVITEDDVIHFLGCIHMNSEPIPPATGWTRKRLVGSDLQNPDKVFPPISPGTKVKAVYIVADEGVDTGGQGSVGLSVIDNININGTLITKPGKSGDVEVSGDTE